jgi:predicted nucleic acid-binding protein
MPGFLPDTSCMIATVCSWHEHHDRAASEIDRRLRRGEKMLVAGPALVESYAVLTRLPPPHRLSPGDALALLDGNFVRRKIISLDALAYRTLLRQAADDGIAGGQTYDAVIGACALKSKAEALLTFNEGHFRSLAEKGIDVVVPGVARA